MPRKNATNMSTKTLRAATKQSMHDRYIQGKTTTGRCRTLQKEESKRK